MTVTTHISNETHSEDQPVIEHDCGYPAGSFACKIRHLQVNTGFAKAANDV